MLVRKIVYSTAEDFEQLRTSEYCVVPTPAFARVKYVLVDDEQVCQLNTLVNVSAELDMIDLDTLRAA